MTRPAYQLRMPSERTTGVVFASPHSGREYPWSFIRNSQLDEHTIRSSEDAFVDQLFEQVPEFGAPLLAAIAPRAFLDLNRSADELDPALISGVQQKGNNPRISSGLGVIPRVVANGREIRRGKMGMGEARRRIAEFYHPYHDALQNLLTQSTEQFGCAILFDCHSMPHEALAATTYQHGQKPEVVLGDRFGASCDPDLMDAVEQVFTRAGLSVSRNAPFAGAYVTQHYGRPSVKQHVVQIEIDRSFYMDEKKLQPNANFDAVKAVLAEVAAGLSDLGRNELRLAAE